jgi:hypothetical protein
MTLMQQLGLLLPISLLTPITAQAVIVSPPVFKQTSYNRYDKAEATFVINALYSNNYDPAIVAADAEITKPSGATVSFPCFYYVPCTFAAQSATYWEATEKTAEATWMLRFAPDETGTYSVRIKVVENNNLISYSQPSTFRVNAGSNKGFIRLNAANKQFMNFDNGTPYYPVGTNVAWNDQRLTQYFADFFAQIPTNGMTWTRYWLTDFARQALEWKSGHWSNWYSGLGKYSQKAAGLLDNVLAQCASKGCYMQLVLQHHGQLSTTTNAQWADNPYNVSQNGPLSNAGQFFTSATAKAQTKKQYRYIVARWGFSTAIMAWEFFNEVNYTDGKTADIDAWHDDMSAYLKSLDIHKHLVTTSTHEANGILQALDNNPHIDQLQFHYYGTNLETSVLTAAQTLDGLLTKPILSGEFGYANNNYLNDNAGDHLRKTLWVNMFNRIPTTFWYWNEYIIPKKLHGIFTPLSNFMSTVDVVKETNAIGGALSFLTNPANNCVGHGYVGTQKAYGFVYDKSYGEWAATATNMSGAVVRLSLDVGNYAVEFWNPQTGATTNGGVVATSRAGILSLNLPTFNKDIAFKVSLMPSVAVRDVANLPTLNVYPTLANAFVTLDIQNIHQHQDVLIQITDVAGRVWQSEKVKNTEGGILRQLSVSDLPDGFYFLVVKMDLGVVSRRFVKQ